MKIPLFTCLLLASWFSASAHAEQNRSDYDVDNNGLIEINDLADLAATGQSPQGKSLYGLSNGCPATGCIGFELTRDVDFDTNGDGRMDAQDAYWNGGAGWLPLESFSGVFDGNGHHIRNLYINRPDFSDIGLFANLESATIRRLQLDGPLMSITGTYTGALAGRAKASEISELVVQGSIRSEYFAGGLIGNGSGNRINGVVIATDIYTTYDSQFVWGNRGNKLSNALLVGHLAARGDALYELGYVAASAQQSIMYVRAETVAEERDLLLTDTEQLFIQVSNTFAANGQPLPSTPAQLRCGQNAQCNGGVNYTGWELQLGSDGKPYWDFGDGNQAAGLRLFGRVFRDSDGDGVFDEDDAFPLLSFASQDTDKDGAPDTIKASCDADCLQAAGVIPDQFPSNPAAALDADLDGKPDAWLPSCDSQCQAASGLVLDTQLNDSDNDGIPNDRDSDDFNTGQLDADSDSDGLIEVHNLQELDAMRFSSDGAGRVLGADAQVDASGCPVVIYQGRRQLRCRGYELTGDLDFDTNHNGVFDEQDTYWNQGAGWQPMAFFSGEFNGNGFQIRSLYVHGNNGLGLFEKLHRAYIQKLVLTGRLLMDGNFGHNAGLIAAYALDSRFEQIVVSGRVEADSLVGAIAGFAQNCTLGQSLSANELVGNSFNGFFGGSRDNRVISSLATGTQQLPAGKDQYEYVSGTHSLERSLIVRVNGAGQPFLIIRGDGQDDGTNSASYFLDSHELTATANNTFSLATLSCATGSDATDCGASLLYQGWGQDKNDQGQPLWNFGNQQQLPGINLFGKVFRDSDGDGVLDAYDRFPGQFAASRDADNDGTPDAWTAGCDRGCQSASALQLDQFPSTAAAFADADLDGRPDSWAASCTAACRTSSGLKLDSALGDSDNDGTPNTLDTDDDGDGKVDADADSNGLIDINSLAQLNAVRFNLKGTGRVLTEGGKADVSGCPAILQGGRLAQQCWGYELKADLDFDTNKDGKMDAQDAYWNGGTGWQALGSDNFPFATRF